VFDDESTVDQNARPTKPAFACGEESERYKRVQRKNEEELDASYSPSLFIAKLPEANDPTLL
jgi:hypothetical protein